MTKTIEFGLPKGSECLGCVLVRVGTDCLEELERECGPEKTTVGTKGVQLTPAGAGDRVVGIRCAIVPEFIRDENLPVLWRNQRWRVTFGDGLGCGDKCGGPIRPEWVTTQFPQPGEIVIDPDPRAFS